MSKENLKKAFRIIEQAELKAEKDYQNLIKKRIVNIERQHKKCLEWYNKNYRPYFGFDRFSKERLAGMLKGLLDDIDRGLKPGFRDEHDAVEKLAERMKILKYIYYLKDIIDDDYE